MAYALDSSKHPTTEQWALSFGISTAATPPTITGYDEPCAFTAREVATRAIVLQGVVAIAFGVDPLPVVDWFSQQHIWDSVSPLEQAFIADPNSTDKKKLLQFRWRKEAVWTLLWVVGKVERLGLPTCQCDTRRLVDEIVPALGSDIEPFLAAAQLRSPGELLAEVDRHYDLWCRYVQIRPGSEHVLPSDLLLDVLYQREYVFEWLEGIESWDDVQCDA